MYEAKAWEDFSLCLEDGVKKIFFNAKDYAQSEDEEIRAFLQYVDGKPGENTFVKRLDAKVKQVKENVE